MVDVFTFDLPENLIAQKPASPRDHAKLLVFDRKTKKITDDYFYNLETYLVKDTTVVLNNSKVENCRWIFNNGKLEIFVLEKHNNNQLTAMVRPGRRFKLGDTVTLTERVTATVLAINDSGHRTLELNVDLDDPELLKYEHVPLPPYIEQNDQLADEYQTVYAKNPGSKAAPTAGLHFTPTLLEAIRRIHDVAEVELQVGLGTFAPLSQENFSTNKLHTEQYYVSRETCQLLARAKHITAVGTTSLRTLESLPPLESLDTSVSGSTDIFIQPGYSFHAVDSLITNFHLPSTSLLLLVEAFLGGRQDLGAIYDHAIAQKYRFYSFGDAMIIL